MAVSLKRAAEAEQKIANLMSFGKSREAAINQVADDMELQTDTIRRYLRSLAEADRRQTILLQPVYHVTAAYNEGNEEVEVLAMGDAHVEPGEDLSRMERAGQYANDTGAEVMVLIGDFGTFDSVNMHDRNHTLAGRSKPSLREDLDAVRAAYDRLRSRWSGPIILTEGNHEQRVDRFVNENPELNGLVKELLFDIYAEYDVQVYPYGAYAYVGGVAFTHAPKNMMGKEYGGKTATRRIAEDAVSDIVYGHSHKAEVAHAVKLPGHRRTTCVNLGSYMPEGRIENYAKHSATGWTYGLYSLTCGNGSIKNYSFISEGRLREIY